jgi:hypothetical protein
MTDTQIFYAFFKEQRTSALLGLYRDHCRDKEARKSFLALCYELRKRGLDV